MQEQKNNSQSRHIENRGKFFTHRTGNKVHGDDLIRERGPRAKLLVLEVVSRADKRTTGLGTNHTDNVYTIDGQTYRPACNRFERMAEHWPVESVVGNY